LIDLRPDHIGPGEADHIHAGMDGQGGGGNPATGDHVDYALWNTCRLCDLCENEPFQWSRGGWLQNNGATGGERRSQLRHVQPQREVVRTDQCRNAIALPDDLSLADTIAEMDGG